MMPDAMLPAMPSADAIAAGGSRSAAPTRAGRGERAEHRRRMEARLVRRHRRDQAEAAQQLDAGGDADEQPVAAEPFALAGGQHGGHDDRAGMHRTALEGVVVVLAVRGGAVDERGAERVERRRRGRCAVHGPPRSTAASVAAT